MDFSQVNIEAFLRSAVPRRFQDISPYEFEDFMAWTFAQDGYTVEETTYSGDFGGDLILSRDGKKTVVQLKRYAPGTPVGVGDVNQVIGAATYYEADEALIITTSQFSGSAVALGRQSGVVLWNWKRLERYLTKVLLGGKEITLLEKQDLDIDVADDAEELLSVTLLQVEYENVLFEKDEAIELHLELTNLTGENLNIQAELPILVKRKSGRQVQAAGWKPHFFFHGLIVAEASVEMCCFILRSQFDEVNRGDRLLMRIWLAGQDEPVVIDTRLKEPRKNCYLVTECYGRESYEYHRMIRFRDEYMERSSLGSFLVSGYYSSSPALIHWSRNNPVARVVVRSLTRRFVCLILRVFRY